MRLDQLVASKSYRNFNLRDKNAKFFFCNPLDFYPPTHDKFALHHTSPTLA